MKSLPKSKMIVSLLLIGLAAIIVGGATMAWFTDDADVADATFTAGTVEVTADGPEVLLPEEKFVDNVNPGDCGTVIWNIVNEGTKAAELRVKISDLWSNDLDTDNVFYCPPADSDWVMYEDAAGDIWLYYTGGPVPGTYGDTLVADRTVELKLVVGFDGVLTDNDYQGEVYTIGGLVEAVQASNDAPAAVWGDVWNEVTADDYDFSAMAGAAYFLTGAGKDMPCWKGPVTPDPDPEKYSVKLTFTDGGTVGGSGTYDAGATVQLTAEPDSGYKFDGWTVVSGGISTPVGELTSFIMPANDVELHASFSAIPQTHKLKVQVKSGQSDYGTVEIVGVGGTTAQLAEDANFTIKATASSNTFKKDGKWYGYKFKRWTRSGSGSWSSTINPYNGIMPGSDVTYTAEFETYRIYN